MTWNYNMDEAPKGHYKDTKRKTDDGEVIKQFVPDYVIIITKDGQKIWRSYWIEDQNRWNFFNGKIDGKPIHEPAAWMHIPDFTPVKELTK